MRLTLVAAAACLLGAATPAVWGQTGSGFTPTLSASTTYSHIDGRDPGRAGAGNSQFLTSISPGLIWSGNSGRIRGSASYELSATHYSKGSEAPTLRNALAGSLTAEAIEGRVFVDASATIGQTSVSPFGTQAVGDGFQAADNRAEVRSVTVSPYLRGELAGTLGYELRHTSTSTSASDTPLGNSSSQITSLSLNSGLGGLFGWGVVASSQDVRFDGVQGQRTDRINLSLSYRPLPELQLGVSGGRESADVPGLQRRSYDNWGFSANWQPTPRTNLNINGDRRYFGNASTVSLSHRMRSSTWTFTDIRGAAGGSNPTGVGQPVTLFALIDSIFTAQQPDPGLRRQLVLDFIRSLGRNPGELVAGGFLTSAVTLQRRQDLAFAITGLRNTLTLQAFRSRTGTLGTNTGNGTGTPTGAGSFGADGDVVLTGLTASASHRLTPTASLSLSGSYQSTQAVGSQPGNDLSSLGLTFSNEASRLISTALSARYAIFDSAIGSYREASVSASISLRF